MRIFDLKIIWLLTLILLIYGTVSTVDARPPRVQVVATDVVYGGAAGALVATGVSLLQDDPDWVDNLRRGTGIGLILGLVLGLYDGFVMQAGHYDHHYGVLNVGAGGIALSTPRLVMSAGGTWENSWRRTLTRVREESSVKFDAFTYRFS